MFLTRKLFQAIQRLNHADERIIPGTEITAALVASNSTEIVCGYSVTLHASDELMDSFESISSSMGVTFTFILMMAMSIVVFCIYDRIVRQRHLAILHAAARSNAIISSLFPTNFRDRLFEEADAEADAETKESKSRKTEANSSNRIMPSLEEGDDDDPVAYKGKPIGT